jgi:MFS superfamily sulfate permease-like transporter
LPARPVGLAVVALAIVVAWAFGLAELGVPTTGEVPAGLPSLELPGLRLRDVEGIVPLAAGCLLLAYIESVSAARTFAAKHGYGIDPRREFLGLGAANLAASLGHGYPVAGGLSQSAVNDKAGARTPLALIFASCALALCLLFLTGLLAHLPKAVLAAVVLTAVSIFRRCFACGGSAEWISTRQRSRSVPCCFSGSCKESCSRRSPPS